MININTEENMEIIKGPNTDGGWVCPICKKNTDKAIVLVGIMGTEDGRKIQAEQFHVDCLDLFYNMEAQVLIQKI
jgi:hypothetical protein